MKWYAVLAFGLSLAGCTMTYKIPPEQQAQFNQDAADCRMRASANENPFIARELIKECLKVKGYVRN